MQKIPLEPSHPYLTLKKIPMLGAKVEGDALVISLTNIKGEIVGSQRILPDGMKKNATGTKLKGSFHRIPPTPERGYRDWETDRKSTRLNSSHRSLSRMPSSA